GNDLGRLASFLQSDGFLDGDLVEWIHRHLDVAELDAGTVRFDSDFHILVDRPLHGHENLHDGSNWLLDRNGSLPRPAIVGKFAISRTGNAAVRETYRPQPLRSTSMIEKITCRLSAKTMLQLEISAVLAGLPQHVACPFSICITACDKKEIGQPVDVFE